MDEEMSGFIKVPKKEKEVEDAWKEKSNEVLKERGSSYRVANTKVYWIIIILLAVIFMGGFSYFTVGGYYQPILNSTCIMPDIPACPSCPSLDCGTQNVTLNIPSELFLNVAHLNITYFNQTINNNTNSS